jgi:hypothetical protein
MKRVECKDRVAIKLPAAHIDIILNKKVAHKDVTFVFKARSRVLIDMTNEHEYRLDDQWVLIAYARTWL